MKGMEQDEELDYGRVQHAECERNGGMEEYVE